VKSSLPKSLVFSFFLLGIILGMVLIDTNVIPLPQIAGERSGENKKNETPNKAKPTLHNKERQVTIAAPKKKPLVQNKKSDVKAIAEPLICDKREALAVRKKAQEIAVITEQGKVLTVTLGEGWAYYTPGIRQSFVERFFASDTCLHGRPREIRFYFRGDEVASTDTRGAIVLK